MNYVSQLLCENDEPKDDPGMDEIKTAVLRLEGSTCTMVLLKGQWPDECLCIGGGFNGLYTVWYTRDNQRFFTLQGTGSKTQLVSMVCGGQRGEYSASCCANQADMLRAVETFASAGVRDEALKW